MKTPPCSRCGFDIETASVVWSTQHMLFVQPLKPRRAGDPLRVEEGSPLWVCGRCHAPGEEIKQVVKTRSSA